MRLLTFFTLFPLLLSAYEESFLSTATELGQKAKRHGNPSHGALLIYEGKPLSKGENTTLTDNDPLAHSVMNLLKVAVKKAPPEVLKKSTLYVSSAPCPMCSYAAYAAGIREVIFLDTDESSPIPVSPYDLYSIAKEPVKVWSKPGARVEGG